MHPPQPAFTANSSARSRERVTAGGPSPACSRLPSAGAPHPFPPCPLKTHLHPSRSGDVHRQTSTEDKSHSLQPLLRKTQWPAPAESLGRKASYFRNRWQTTEYTRSNHRLKPLLILPQVASKIFSYKVKIPKASNEELKLGSYSNDSYLSKPLFSLSFTLEPPGQKSGKANSHQSDPDLHPQAPPEYNHEPEPCAWPSTRQPAEVRTKDRPVSPHAEHSSPVPSLPATAGADARDTLW